MNGNNNDPVPFNIPDVGESDFKLCKKYTKEEKDLPIEIEFYLPELDALSRENILVVGPERCGKSFLCEKLAGRNKALRVINSSTGVTKSFMIFPTSVRGLCETELNIVDTVGLGNTISITPKMILQTLKNESVPITARWVILVFDPNGLGIERLDLLDYLCWKLKLDSCKSNLLIILSKQGRCYDNEIIDPYKDFKRIQDKITEGWFSRNYFKRLDMSSHQDQVFTINNDKMYPDIRKTFKKDPEKVHFGGSSCTIL